MPHPENDSATPALPTDLATMSLADFAPYMQQTFEAQGAGEQSVPLVLTVGRERPECTLPNAPRTSFFLLFAGPLEGPWLDGGNYILRHPEGGESAPVYLNRVMPPPGAAPAAYYQMIVG
ncbi:DUF6916 family protein [Novispirillum sp. DQ9]|uniref:DUF6916 family protein n=1 Tax=Novispirillum sp. DQ9 TaxID=3398612 RepID=UPI003C797D1A